MTHHKQHQKQPLVCGLFALSAALCGLSAPASAATIYVKADGGSNSYPLADAKNNSLKPYQTIKKALQLALTTANLTPTQGDPDPVVNTIIVEPGVYPEAVTIDQAGLTLKARNYARSNSSSRSIIKPSGPNVWDIVSINASDVNVIGFEVDGSNAYVDGTTDTGTYGATSNGVMIYGQHLKYGTQIVIPPALRVTVSNCVVHNAGGGGICSQNPNEPTGDLSSGPTGGPDYVTIEDNIIYNNCFWSRWQPSGISLHSNTNSNPGDLNFHNFVRRNRIYGNTSKYTGMSLDNPPRNYHTDGNGIIIDMGGNQNPPTLVENNLVYKNGGRGIHVFGSSNVTVRNNSTYKNSLDPDVSSRGGGELTAVNCQNVKIVNNVAYGNGQNFIFRVEAASYFTSAGGKMLNVVLRANTFYGGLNGVAGTEAFTPVVANKVEWTFDWDSPAANTKANPLFINAEGGDFRVNAATSPTPNSVIDRASTITEPYRNDFSINDFTNTARPSTDKDRGAHERSLTVLPQSQSLSLVSRQSS